MREYVVVLRALLCGEEAVVEGKACRLMSPDGVIAKRPISTPLIAAVDGPRALANAKDIADGGAKVAARLRTGTVPINSPMLLDFRSPFGGFKQSGIGRELGPEGIAPYTEYRSIIFPPRA